MRETATNQQTGAKLYRDDQGAWQPLESATNPQTGQTAYKIDGKWEVQDRRDTPQQEPYNAPWQEDVKGFIREVGSGATFGQSDRLADAVQEAENYWRNSWLDFVFSDGSMPILLRQ